jgi:SPP1 gp7 family putative phage head morphogenesis protein
MRGNPTMVPLTEVINALTNPQGGASGVPLPVDPRNRNPFGPGDPLSPVAIDGPRPDTGRPEPRVAEYQVNVNVQLTSDRPLDWKILRKAAREVGLIRECIEKRKGHVKPLRWGWVVSDDAVEEQLEEQQVPRGQRRAQKEDVEAELRQRLRPEISRLNSWWRTPWSSNQLTFKQWIGLLLEELLVLDAVVIYPEMTYGGQVLNFKIIDGSTIKPLRDVKGEIPQPPYPAFQQILYGFPRGEFTATMVQTATGETVIPGAYGPDQLYYFRDVVRNETPYGMSAVEQALVEARIWLNRMGWLISEYDDGTGPHTWLVPPQDASSALGEKFTPQKQREWQRAYNDRMAGNTAERQRTQIAPPGFEPHQMTTVEAQYKPEYDMFLIRLIASKLGITMPELNFTEPGGLGSTGYHEGQEDVQERVGTKPAIDIIQTIVTDLGRKYQHAPAELEFRIFGLDSDDEAAADEVIDQKFRRGSMTLNETRDEQGRPRYDFAEADMPMIVTQRGVIFLEGASETAPPGELVSPAQAPPNSDTEPGADAEPDDEGDGKPKPKPTGAAQPTRAAKSAELEAYRNWKRHGRGRAKSARFELRSLTPAEAIGAGVDLDRVSFKAAGDGDPKDQAPDGAESAQQWPGWDLDLAAAAYWAPRIADALSGAVDAQQLAEDWIAHHPTTGAVDADQIEAAAATWIERERAGITGALTDVLHGVYTDGYLIGATSATAVMDGTAVDTGDWVTGATEAAELLLSHLGDGSGLRTLLNQAGITIKSVVSTRLDELGRVLAEGAARGDSADEIAASIRSVLQDKSRALMIATTELNRAVSAATANGYTKRGISLGEWATAEDDRVCPICHGNQDAGAVRIGEPYPSGDIHPPGHPWCRCALLPVLASDVPMKGDAQ